MKGKFNVMKPASERYGPFMQSHRLRKKVA